MLITIDRNILIAALKIEPTSSLVATIFTAHRDGNIAIAISAANRVEYRVGDEHPQTEEQFLHDCSTGGLDNPTLLDYPLDWEMGLWESSIIDAEGFDLDTRIHAVLFPNLPNFLSTDQNDKERRRIRNVRCDVFAIWGHIRFDRDYFITSDQRFLKRKDALVKLGARGICTPEEFVKNVLIPAP
ncbi:hypothetical protein [Perlucidibaca aquatica]|uniref:hypothetical protein n=1 Tax=Perlucidibaca aquatica TaxID=1852776 RepID=UPI00083A81BA|nr:hypothetical protein [Perlucidibaca aquatica]